MSRRGKLVHESAIIALNNFNGSLGDRSRKRHFIDMLSIFLWNIGVKPMRLAQIPLWTVELYSHICLAMGVSPGTVINRVSAIRMILSRAGADVSGTLPAELGIPRRDRIGKKIPWNETEIEDLILRAIRIDEGFALLIELQWLLGLRAIEALRCANDLGYWVELLARGQHFLPANRGTGTKGARPRNISIISKWRTRTILAIRRAHEYAQAHGGRLIVGRINNSRGSMNRLKKLYQRAGLTGPRSSHSLRYTYCCENATERIKRGENLLHVLGEVCEDMGHGKKTRRRFILTTYLNSISHLFEDLIKNGKLISAPCSSIETVDHKSPWYVPRSDDTDAKQTRRDKRKKSMQSKRRNVRG
jgi:integrase